MEATYHHLKKVSESRGELIVGEYERHIPFLPKRFFLVQGVPAGESRGFHAHFTCHQFLICIQGSVSVDIDDGNGVKNFILNKPNIGLLIPNLKWGVQKYTSPDDILLVFASEYYDDKDYIKDYNIFKDCIRSI